MCVRPLCLVGRAQRRVEGRTRSCVAYQWWAISRRRPRRHFGVRLEHLGIARAAGHGHQAGDRRAGPHGAGRGGTRSPRRRPGRCWPTPPRAVLVERHGVEVGDRRQDRMVDPESTGGQQAEHVLCLVRLDRPGPAADRAESPGAPRPAVPSRRRRVPRRRRERRRFAGGRAPGRRPVAGRGCPVLLADLRPGQAGAARSAHRPHAVELGQEGRSGWVRWISSVRYSADDESHLAEPRARTTNRRRSRVEPSAQWRSSSTTTTARSAAARSSSTVTTSNSRPRGSSGARRPGRARVAAGERLAPGRRTRGQPPLVPARTPAPTTKGRTAGRDRPARPTGPDDEGTGVGRLGQELSAGGLADAGLAADKNRDGCHCGVNARGLRARRRVPRIGLVGGKGGVHRATRPSIGLTVAGYRCGPGVELLISGLWVAGPAGWRCRASCLAGWSRAARPFHCRATLPPREARDGPWTVLGDVVVGDAHGRTPRTSVSL